MTVILLVLLLPIALTFFLPLAWPLYAAAAFLALFTVIFGWANLSAYRPSAPEFGSMLGLTLLSAALTAGVYLAGKCFGHLRLSDILSMLF